MTALLIAGSAAGAFLAIAGVLRLFGKLAATLTRIHDAVTDHLPARIDHLEREIGTTRTELRADHAEVRSELHEMKQDLRNHIHGDQQETSP